MKGRGKRRAVRRLVAECPDQRCSYCRVQMADPKVTGGNTPETRTIDHLTPRILGGSNQISNLALSCNDCNQRKGRMLPLEFIIARGMQP